MKKLIILFLTSFLLLSCENEPSEDQQLRSLIDFEKVAKTIKMSYFNEDEIEILYLDQNSLNKNSSLYQTNFLANRQEGGLYKTQFPLRLLTKVQIENFQKHKSDNYKIVGITGFHLNSGELKGVGFYIYDVTKSNLSFYLYSIVNSKFSLVEGFPKKTLDTDVKDIIFLSSMYFPTCDYSLIRLDSYEEFALDYSNNDLRFHLLNRHLQNNANFLESVTVIRNENGNVLRMAGDPCSLAVHRCADGTPGSLCNGSFCWAPPQGPQDQDTTIQDGGGAESEEGTCSRKKVGAEIKSKIGQESFDTFVSNLPLTTLYNLKDKLNSTTKGKTYVYMYYYTNLHLANVFDMDLLVDMYNISFKLGQPINDYLNNSTNKIIDNNLAADLKDLFQKIKSKSSNSDFRDFLDVLIFEVDNLKGLNSSQINNYLN